MKQREKPNILDLEEAVYDLDAIANILSVFSGSDSSQSIHKSLYMLSNLIYEKTAIIEDVMNHELTRLRAEKGSK